MQPLTSLPFDGLKVPQERKAILERKLQHLFIIDIIKIIVYVVFCVASVLFAQRKGYTFIAAIITGGIFQTVQDFLGTPYLCQDLALKRAIERESRVIEKMKEVDNPRLARIEVVKEELFRNLDLPNKNFDIQKDFSTFKASLKQKGRGFALNEIQTMHVAKLFFFLSYLQNKKLYRTSTFSQVFTSHFKDGTEKERCKIRGGVLPVLEFSGKVYFFDEILLPRSMPTS